jgi:hypothetical protein
LAAANSQLSTITVMLNTSPVGIKSVNFQTKLVSIYPNPSSDSFKIQLSNEIDNGELVLINSLGQKVIEQKIKQGENEIVIEKISKGSYHYIISKNKQQICGGKLIIE